MLNQIDLARADLNLLVLFQVVLEERHVGRAAARMNLSASAISHGLGRLRRLLDDPLFLRTPKGVVPTDRALELAGPISEMLASVGRILSTAAPFDPAVSTRRFTIGAPDGISAVVLPGLTAAVRQAAPSIDIGIRQLLPTPTGLWQHAIEELDTRVMDIAILPAGEVPVRFAEATLYEEQFVIAMRRGHGFAENPSLDRFCAAEHLVVSLGGDPHGFVDAELAGQGRSRRVALTTPNFFFALAMLAESDLIAALPRSFVDRYGDRFDIVAVEAPLPLQRFQVRAVASKAALADAGLAWFFDRLREAAPSH